MIHPANEGSQIAKKSFDLGSEFKLPFAMNVGLVLDRPPRINPSIDAPAIRLQFAVRFYELVEKLTGIGLTDNPSWKNAEGDLGGADLFGHDQRDILEIGFIHLHRPGKNRFKLRQMESELPEPEIDCLLVHLTKLLRLQNWNSLCPAPE